MRSRWLWSNFCQVEKKLIFADRFSFHIDRQMWSDNKSFFLLVDLLCFFFYRKDKLKQHEARHSAMGGMFQCEICLKTFVRPEHLRDHHIVRHSHQFPFRWEICFFSNYRKIKHFFFFYSCEFCCKGFLHQTQLYTHHKQQHSTANENFQGTEQ